MFDGIEFRGFSQRMVEELAEFSGVPVWNGLTDEWHPTQMLADYLTIKENFGKLEGITLVYCGDGRNNVANSLLVAGTLMGVNVHIFSPKELFPAEEIVKLAEEYAKESGAHVLVTDNVDEAVKGADVFYTDVWVSMGEEDKFKERVELLQPYQVNMELIKKLIMIILSSYTAYLHSMIQIPFTAKTSLKNLASRKWKLLMKSSVANMLVISTKLKIVCTLLKL